MKIIVILISFLSGALPISLWLGQLFFRKDIRQFGDGNPGATNVFRAGNSVVGVLALIMDISKAAIPVGLAYDVGHIRGLPMLLIGSAPVIGHIFSPFLRFKGGKGLAAALGVWIGLTKWTISTPAVFGVVIGIILITSPGWAVMFSLLVILIIILVWYPFPLLINTWIVQAVLMIWTHRSDLAQKPQLREWLCVKSK